MPNPLIGKAGDYSKQQPSRESEPDNPLTTAEPRQRSDSDAHGVTFHRAACAAALLSPDHISIAEPRERPGSDTHGVTSYRAACAAA
ncbi:MAG TPA: hypothetical protein ENN97_06505, partial [Phycisphaerales bacterium]|nr:hypothetical protein [Phycisphaerales bacterium]